MLLPYKDILKEKKVILGSQSQTRNRLLKVQCQTFDTISSTFKEDLDKNSFKTSAQYCLATVKGKIDQLTSRFQKEGIEWNILICGDTIIDLNGQILQKPVDFQHCVKMMSSLVNRKHKCITSNYIIVGKEVFQWIDQADVTFGQIPKQAIQAYAKTPYPYKHSGGYQVIGLTQSFINEINGSFTAIQGLNIHRVCHSIIQGLKRNNWIK